MNQSTSTEGPDRRRRSPLAATLVPLLVTGCLFNPPDAMISASEASDGTSMGESSGGSGMSGGATGVGTSEGSGASSSTDPGMTTEDDSTTAPDPALCEQIGGEDGLKLIVEDFTARLQGDVRINGYFLNDTFINSKYVTCMTDYLAALIDCPGAEYSCADVASAHQGMGISGVDRADYLELLVGALQDHQQARAPALGDDGIQWIIAQLDDESAQVVEDEEGTQTVYQRLGRQPKMREMLEGLDELVAGDMTLSAFFGDQLGNPRKALCMERHLIGDERVGGPTVYRAEHDSLVEGALNGLVCSEIRDAHSSINEPKLLEASDYDLFLERVATATENTWGAPEFAEGDRVLVQEYFDAQCVEVVADRNNCPGSRLPMSATLDPDELDAKRFFGTNEANKEKCLTLHIPEGEEEFYVDTLTLDVEVDHKRVGNLIITLAHEDQTSVLVVDRPDSGAGNKTVNLDCDAPVTFKDLTIFPAEQLGLGLIDFDTSRIVCSPEDEPMNQDPCEYRPVEKFDVFTDAPAAGDWQICIGVNEPGFQEQGEICEVRLNLETKKFANEP